MTCTINQPYYIPVGIRGIKLAASKGDANIISLFWNEAFPQNNYNLGYNIYFSTERDNVFSEGPKFISTNLEDLTGDIYELTPGDTYFFAVRAFEYLSSWYNISLLPDSSDGYSGLKVYPETLLLSDISDSDVNIPIADISIFPPYGIIQIGTELIRYDNIDLGNSLLIAAERGFLNSDVNLHTVDGYDGYELQSPIIKFFKGLEEQNGFVIQEENKFSYPNYAFTVADGYKEKVDLLNSDLSSTETTRIEDFTFLDHSGWRRNTAEDVLGGKCIDSYILGEQGCADGYMGVGQQIRGISITQLSDQREEELLENTGEPVVLVKKLWKGIICPCVEPNKETPESRCKICYGSGFITGFEQFYNPKRSDGRILVRFGPATEDLKRESDGIESSVILDSWTLVFPIIRDSDFIIRFNDDGTEEFRYEVLNVVRNKLLFAQSGNQHFQAQRVRKTDSIYQWKAFRNTATMPMKLNTSVGLLRGPGTMIPHVHEIVVNENTISLSQINQTTSYAAGHNHEVRAGVVIGFDHQHSIIL